MKKKKVNKSKGLKRKYVHYEIDGMGTFKGKLKKIGS